MLTDYHLHLRPDEDDTPAERYLHGRERRPLPGRGGRRRDRGARRLRARLPLHARRSTSGAIRFWEENAHDDLDAYCEFVRGTSLRLGSSATSSPAPRTAPPRCWRRATSTTWSARSTSSASRAVDHDGWDVWEGGGDPDEVWRRYFESLAECARSGLFDILAHPDLVKVWGGARPLPERDLRFFYEPAVEAIAESGIAVEVSTAGLRKPVGEIYPARGLRRDVRRGGGALRALLRCPPARAGRLRLRAGGRVPRRARGRRDLRLRGARAPARAARRRVGEDSER